jgi:hypothetical protein
MTAEILFPTVIVPYFDMVPDTHERDLILKPRSVPKPFVQQQPPLAIKLNLTAQRKTHPLERYRFIGGRRSGCHGKNDLLVILFGIKTKDPVRAKYQIEIAAMLLTVDLIAKLVGDEDPAFAIDYVLIFAC